MIKSKTFSINTSRKTQVINITKSVSDIVAWSGVRNGMAIVHSSHTTLGIGVNENETNLLTDTENWLEGFVKENPDKPFLHDCMWLRPECPATEPHNAPAHLTNTFIGPSKVIPVINGQLALGKWQQVLAYELDGKRNNREVMVMVQGDIIEDGLEGYWREKAQLINEAIDPYLDKTWEGEMLGMSQYIARGGKRLRGVLALLVCECLGGDVDKAMDAAVAVEITQSASLAKDDLQDGDKIRRKGMAAWVAYGARKATGMVDVMIPHALAMLKKYGSEAVYVALDAWKEMGTGQVKDLFLGNVRDKDVYEEIIKSKTAALFGLATVLGAIASKANKAQKKAASDYGRALGTLLQVADDWADSLSQKAIPISFEAWAEGDIKGKVDELIKKTEKSAMVFPDNEFRNYLVEMPRFIVDKMLGEAEKKV